MNCGLSLLIRVICIYIINMRRSFYMCFFLRKLALQKEKMQEFDINLIIQGGTEDEIEELEQT